MQKKLLVLNDLHVGSCYGMLPPNFLDTEGNTHNQNEGQQFLWDRFTHTLSRLRPQNVDYIILNGDLLDGKQPKSRDRLPLTLCRLEDQIEAAVKVLEEVRNTFPNAKWFFVEGTPYHELGEQIKAVSHRLLNQPHEVRRTLTLAIGNAKIRFHHETSFTAAPGKAGSLERELITGWASESMDNWPAVHCEVRAHTHYFAHVGRKDRLAIVCPCWQLQTEYTTKNSPTKNIPDIGCVVLHVDDSLLDYGVCPVSFSEYLYKHPQPEITVIQEEEVLDVENSSSEISLQ